MADNFGTGVSRVLDPKKTQISQVVWQQGRPPLDSELSAISQFANELQKNAVLAGQPSGWLGNGINDIDAYATDPTWSNWFQFGQQRSGELGAIQWANVNGWLIPVTGTRTGTPPGSPDNAATWNRVTLDPPPSNSGDNRVDFVFLEVWQALIPPNPGTTNKPSASTLYRYGNVESGMSYLADESVDPSIGFETTQRVQLQYRIRVVKGLVGLSSFPDGFDPASVKARGAAANDTTFTFTNMRQELGDAGLWRAGNGSVNSLGTVDGYSYAIPLAVVFRRNSVAFDGHPGQNLNGGFNRNPSSVDRTGYKTFSTVPTLSADLTASATSLTLSSALNIPLPASPASPVYIQVGDEIMTYTGITGNTVSGLVRGALGTKAEAHKLGSVAELVAGRPDGLFADQIAKTDILDLRHIVNPGGFDYDSLLRGALDGVLKGTMRSNWRRSGSSPIGTWLTYQDLISASSPALGVAKLDSPDGQRVFWANPSVLQPVEFIASVPTGATASENVSTAWDLQVSGVTADNSGGASGSFKAGATITIPISAFKNSVPGSDIDQVTFPKLNNSGSTQWVFIRKAGDGSDLVPGVDFNVTSITDSSSNLVITLTAFTDVSLNIRFMVQYGAGRGMSHRPDAVHSLSFTNASSGTYLRQRNSSTGNVPISVGFLPLSAKYRSETLGNQIPVVAESYVDPGSGSVMLTPFRQIDLPTGNEIFKAVKDDGIHGTGVMPLADADPFELFSSHLDANLQRNNTFVVLPRHLVPGWGAVHAPIIHTDSGTLVEGINYLLNSPKGVIAGSSPLWNFMTFGGSDSKSFSTFTTIDLTTIGITNTPATYNALSSADQGAIPAGMRKFTDTRGLGRQGLEAPPYYLPTRLFSVYEAADFHVNGSAYNSSTRALTGTGAKNLLRQDFDGPVFFIEVSADGDPTYVLNAEALDLSKSPNAIADFASGNFVMEATIAGVDRGSFDLNDDFRLVMPRARPDATDAAVDPAVNSSDVTLVIPAPAQGADSVVVNYSRTGYQFGAFDQTGQDSAQLVGPLGSAVASQLGYTELDEATLTRPNPKVFEVLASLAFTTTLGTGRFSSDWNEDVGNDFRNPGYQDTQAWPPASPVAARPVWYMGGALSSTDELVSLGTGLNGVSTRLPLGSLFRDHDFHGESLQGITGVPSPLLYLGARGAGTESTSVAFSQKEYRNAPVFTADQASGAPGEVIVHCDGNSSNYNLTSNFRTTRGGSAFVANGPNPGGELSAVLGSQPSGFASNATLGGIAYLVRNQPTNIGSSEVSAGGELMLLVATTVTRRNFNSAVPTRVLCSTSGSGEGFSSVDYARIPGHPLENDSVRQNIDPTAIRLSPKKSLKPRIGG